MRKKATKPKPIKPVKPSVRSIKKALEDAYDFVLTNARDTEAFPYTLYLKWCSEVKKGHKHSLTTTFKAVLDASGKYFVLTRHDTKKSLRQFDDKWNVIIPQETLNAMILRKIFKVRKGGKGE